MQRIALLSLFLIFAACGANDKILQSGKGTPTPAAAPRSAIEDDLTSMRNADFRFVYVLRRKDGGAIDAEDRAVIKVNTMEANRRISSDNDTAFIIGTNNAIAADKMAALYARFAVEDHSPPVQSTTNAVANAAANANANTGK